MVVNSLAENQSSFGYNFLISKLSEINSGATLINDDTYKNNQQDNIERDENQILEIKGFNVENSICKCKINFKE